MSRGKNAKKPPMRRISATDKDKVGGSTPQKIGIFGLDNAGKTTIVNVIQGEKSLDLLANLQPTYRVQIEQLLEADAQWVIWDFGGQEAFREEYLNSPELFFDDIGLLIFVIDVQDMDRVEVALDYFSQCLDYYKQFSGAHSKNVLVLLHKSDPDIMKDARVQLNLQFLRDQVAIVAKNHQFSARIHTSTIFDEKLHLESEVAGSIDMEKVTSGVGFVELIAAAKTFHAKLREIQQEDFGEEQDTPTVGQDMAGKHVKAQNPQRGQTLKMLSLERKRIIEEFNALLKR